MITKHGTQVRTVHFLLLLAVYAAARYQLIGHLGSPVFGWRPTDMGAIALNYYRNGFHFFYPQVRWGGAGPGYVETEFPLVPFTTAILFKLFGAEEWVQVIVPLLAGMGLVWATYCFGRYLFGPWAGLAAGAVVASVPTLVMLTTTGMWPDPPTLLFATLGLYLLSRWEGEDKWTDFILGSLCISLAILLKLPTLYIGAPVAYLTWKRYGHRLLSEPAVWAGAAIMLVPPALWYWHAHQLYDKYHNTFGILGAGYLKFATTEELFDPSFYARIPIKLALYHWTPIGAIGFLYGLYLVVRGRNGVLIAWLLSVLVCIFVAAKGVRDGHYQYLLPVLPVGAIVAGHGISALLRRVEPLVRGQSEYSWKAILVGCAVLFAADSAYAAYRFQSRDRVADSRGWLKKKLTGERLKSTTRPDSLLIVVDTEMDLATPERSMTPPDVFYFSERRGWYLSMAWLTTDRIESLRREGASYFVVSGQSVSDFKTRRSDILNFLKARYRKVMDDDRGVAFDLSTHVEAHGATVTAQK